MVGWNGSEAIIDAKQVNRGLCVYQQREVRYLLNVWITSWGLEGEAIYEVREGFLAFMELLEKILTLLVIFPGNWPLFSRAALKVMTDSFRRLLVHVSLLRIDCERPHISIEHNKM